MRGLAMDANELEVKIQARGRVLFDDIRGQTPSIFNKSWWTGKVLDWSMRHEHFKVQLFRFIDVLPYLTSSESFTRHIQEYFGGHDLQVPAVFRWAATGAAMGGKFAAGIVDKTVRANIEQMARQFIIGQDTHEAVSRLGDLRGKGLAFTVDLLGEATVSEAEADRYAEKYMTLLATLEQSGPNWPGLGNGGELDWAVAPKINISVKASSLYSQINPADFEGSVRGIFRRIKPICMKIKQIGGFLCIDMEQHQYKDITLELYRRIRSDPEFRDYPHMGVVLQAYLLDTDRDLDELLGWARSESVPISIRLVKGAYWDYETVIAKRYGWRVPVYTVKAETDAAFERHADKILKNHDICYFACGSHNIRSICAVMETARALDVPDDRYEFQLLYGMAEPIQKALLDAVGRVRLYCPYGDLLGGMAYLVRRLLENTSNESFLRQSFSEQVDVDRLMEDPKATLENERGQVGSSVRIETEAEPPAFKNEPRVDFTVPDDRAAFPRAIANVRKQLGRVYPLVIGGREVQTDTRIDSVNPADPSEIVGRVSQAGPEEIDAAIRAARRAFQYWSGTSAQDRAEYIFRAAQIARRRIFELAAWQVLEVGKQWDQAHADVTESIDFMNYYAREMLRLAEPRSMGRVPGEANEYFYRPKGLAAIIAPWNFPLAISCGMSTAAIVTGNCVIYKPSGLSSVVGFTLAEIFKEAGLPPGVFNYTPGPGRLIGDFLVEHPNISLIAFTGSMEVGLRIMEKAARVRDGQPDVKKVIAEMGGKNAIIIDDDADLDQAVPETLASAFGYQGQKCSACSRVIVLDAIYKRFVHRLAEAAASLKIGPAEDPANYCGPLVDRAAKEKIIEYIEIGKREGRLLYESEVPESEGYYVPLTIIEGLRPEHRLAQEEVFGPVLAVMRARDLDEAIEWANSTPFALTGSVFSRNPGNLAKACRRLQVGNLYLNQRCTGALVERQPFGGFKMSGIGSKAGGPDYLLQFLDPRTISENTLRRGFAPSS